MKKGELSSLFFYRYIATKFGDRRHRVVLPTARSPGVPVTGHSRRGAKGVTDEACIPLGNAVFNGIKNLLFTLSLSVGTAAITRPNILR